MPHTVASSGILALTQCTVFLAMLVTAEHAATNPQLASQQQLPGRHGLDVSCTLARWQRRTLSTAKAVFSGEPHLAGQQRLPGVRGILAFTRKRRRGNHALAQHQRDHQRQHGRDGRGCTHPHQTLSADMQGRAPLACCTEARHIRREPRSATAPASANSGDAHARPLQSARAPCRLAVHNSSQATVILTRALARAADTPATRHATLNLHQAHYIPKTRASNGCSRREPESWALCCACAHVFMNTCQHSQWRCTWESSKACRPRKTTALFPE